MTTSGFFITLEGGEGAGKSTQQRILADRLTARGYTCVCTREPGGTALGQRLRSLLLHEQELTVSATAELLLYAADRAEHVTQVIQPALRNGSVVISDRFMDSMTVYQGYGRGLNLNMIEQLNQLAVQGIPPDLTVWLDIPFEVGLERVQARRAAAGVIGAFDRMEDRQQQFHRRLWQGFQLLASQDPDRIHRIDGQGEIEVVAKRIETAVLTRLSL